LEETILKRTHPARELSDAFGRRAEGRRKKEKDRKKEREREIFEKHFIYIFLTITFL